MVSRMIPVVDPYSMPRVMRREQRLRGRVTGAQTELTEAASLFQATGNLVYLACATWAGAWEQVRPAVAAVRDPAGSGTATARGAAVWPRQLRQRRLRQHLRNASGAVVRPGRPRAGTHRRRMHQGPAGGPDRAGCRGRRPDCATPGQGAGGGPFAGSANTLSWISRHLPAARAVGFEQDPGVFAITPASDPAWRD